MRSPYRSFLSTLLLATLLALGDLRSPAAGSENGTPYIDVHDGLLSVRITEDASVATMLGVIANKAGIPLTIHGTLGTVRDIAFSRLPIAEGLQSLAAASNSDFVLVFRPTSSGTPQLTGIQAYARAQARSPALPTPPAPPPAPPPAHLLDAE